MSADSPVRFTVVGLEHPHVYAMTMGLMGGGAELAGYHSDNDEAAAGFDAVFDRPSRVESLEAVLDDATVDLVVPVGVPAERAAVAAAAMRAGKDVLTDKPAVTTAAQLADVRATQAETGRIFSVWFSERFESRATVRASRLVAEGAIGQVAQVVGFGPHRLGIEGRPPWFFDPDRAGGILNDLASHQIDQFLHFAGADGGAEDVEVVSSMVANRSHPDHPQLEDYGEIHLRTATTSGFARVDWFTPDGLPTWGDVRLLVLGTEGYLEVRKNIDIGGREGGDHLFLVDRRETRRFDCRQDPLPFVGNLLDDLRTRGSTHMSQDHCFAVCDLALLAQAGAARMGHLGMDQRPQP
jgi:predicted dehydrogenase